MNDGFLFPVIKSNFHFNRLQISDGIFLIDISTQKISINNKNNVGILIIPEKLEVIPHGNVSDIEAAMDVSLLYCFIKTNRTYSINECYEIEISENGKVIKKFKKSTDIFKKYGWAIWSYEKFLFGIDRHNLLTHDLLNIIKKGRKHFKNYYSLANAQLYPERVTPLGVAMETFVAAFGNNGQDEPKFLLLLTALEALFSTSSSEVNFRLSSNIAWFLHPKFNAYPDRRLKFEEIKKLYNTRSQIVHGGYKEIKSEEFDSIFDLFSEIIQMILETYNIQHIFVNKEKHKEFIKKLELGFFDSSI